MEPDYYAILKVPETASPEEVQEAYRRLVKQYHPDRSGADTAGLFRAVQEAWETLGNPERRRDYDRRRRDEGSRRPGQRSFSVGGGRGGRTPGWDADPFAGTGDGLHLELRMSPAEARSGGDIEVDLPMWVRCWPCGGRGRLGVFLCPACGGQGRDLRPDRFTLHVPAGLIDGQLIHVPLGEHDLAYAALVIHVRVG